MSDGKSGVEYEIGAKDATGSAVSSATSKIKSFASAVGGNLMNIKAGFDMLASAAKSALAKLQKAFRFETMTVQFKTLIGSMDEARAHMAMLQKMGDTPPFSMEAFAAASRAMMVMSDGALGFQASLELVGDAATATGQPIETLAHEVGRAYAVIRDGQPLTRATMGLRNMGAITPEVAERLDDLQKAGASNAEIWDALVKELGKFKGAMAETEQTGEGLMGAIQSQWDDAVRTFGSELMETAKGGLSLVLAKLKELNEDGTINVWADKVGSAMKGVCESLKTAIGWFAKVKKAYDWVRDGLEVIGSGVGSFVGTLMGGGTLGEAREAFTRGMGEMAMEQDGRKADEAKREEKIRAEAVEKRQDEERKAAEENAKHEAKLKKQLAEAQTKITAKREEEARKKLEKAIAKERERELRKELHDLSAASSAAASRLADARSETQAAQKNFGETLTGSGRRNLRKDERKAAKEERRFQSRLAKLREKYGDDLAPTAFSDEGLTISEKATRRLAYARANEKAAGKEMERAAKAAEECEKHLAKLAEQVEVGGD